METSNKGIIIGLDGVDYDFLMDNEESFDNLSSLLSSGCYGRLKSTIPPTTSAAWSAAFSGMSPGRTGVTDFETDGEDSHIVNSSDVEVPRVWDVANNLDRRVAVIGVPLTYPITLVDGLMVSGFLSPENPDRYHPAAVKKHLPDEYEFFLKYSEYGPSEEDMFLDRLYGSTDAKFEVLREVIRGNVPGSEDVELVCFVLSETDMAQHYFRKQPTADGYEEGEQRILKLFEHVDDQLGKVLDLTEGWNVGLLSDHGFGKNASKHIHINQWLIDEGYLSLDEGTNKALTGFVRNNVRSILRLPGADYLKRLVPSTAVSKVATLESLSDDEIDWDRTVARFSQGESNVGFIDITDGVGDRGSVAEEIVTKLRRLRDPETGERLLEGVYRREEYYAGPDVAHLPDVVFVYDEVYTGSERPNDDIVAHIPPSERPPTAHKMDGFYCFDGPAFTSGREDAAIIDFIPTIYGALDVPLPEDTDGTVIESALDAEPDQFSRREYAIGTDRAEHTNSTDEVRDRLEELGYV